MSSPSPISISTVRLGAEVEEMVLDVLRSGIIAQGPMVQRLEDEFALLVGVRNAVAVNNGTTALIAALQVLDLPAGTEVITSPFTFVATVNAVLGAGLAVRFADISLDDFCLRPDAVDALVGPRTSAILPVHLYGQCADMPAIASIAAESGIPVVEDAAQAHGASVSGRHAGAWGTGCFSLYATKNLTSAEGGLVTTDDDGVADRLRVLRNQGMRRRYEYEMAGNNYRMTDLQAAICIPQLATYDDQVARRGHNAARLTEGLAGLDGVRTPAVQDNRTHVWHQYTLLVEPNARLDRDGLAAHLAEHGVGCGIYYPRVVFDYDCYRDHPRVLADAVPTAQQAAERCLSLPVHPHLSESDLDRIVSTVRLAMES